MKLFVMDFFSLHKQTLCRPMLFTHLRLVYSHSSGEIGWEVPEQCLRLSFGLNRAYIKIRTPNSPCTDNNWFFEYFYGFLGFVVWEISGHFWGVYQSHYCASAVAFLFSFVYVIYLNIASYLYGKQIKSKFGLSCIYEWFSFVYAWIGYISMSAVPCPLTIHAL